MVRGWMALAAMMSLAGCDEGALMRPDSGASSTFIALARDFEGFRDWTCFPLERPMVPVGLEGSAASVCINQLPPEGERRFPVGTILVKAIESGETPQDWVIHAMVKRGGLGFGGGTPGWEVFELRLDARERPVILWRGEGPPSGLGYGIGAPDGGVTTLVCSDCHAPAWRNDSVLNPHVRLRY